MNKQITWIFFLSLFFIQQVNAQDKFLSLKNNKVNVRFGPSMDYPIKYIYKKLNLPVKLIDKKDNFRRIIDLNNNSGWIHWTQLKKPNSIIILEDEILFKRSSNFSKPILRLKKGRLLVIKKCKEEWCNVMTENYSGWLKVDNVWGKTN